MEITDQIIKVIFDKTPTSFLARAGLFAVAAELSESDFAIFLSAVPEDNELYSAFKARREREEGKIQYGFSEYAAEVLFIEKNKERWKSSRDAITAKFKLSKDDQKVFDRLVDLYFDLSERGDKEFAEIVEELPDESPVIIAITEFGGSFYSTEED